MADSSTLVMPKLGLTMTEGTITEWRVQPGESFDAGQIIAVVETEKIANEVEAPAQGLMNEHVAGSGQTVSVGSPIARWSLSGEAPTPKKTSGQPQATAESTAALPAASAPNPVPEKPHAPRVKSPHARVVATPLARRMAREGGIDLRSLTGSGPGGRIKAADVSSAQPAGGARRNVPSALSANTGLLFAAVNAGELLTLVEKLGDVPEAEWVTPVHIAYLAVAKSLLQCPDANQVESSSGEFVQSESTNIGLLHPRGATALTPVLSNVAGKTLKAIIAEAAAAQEQPLSKLEGNGERASIAVAETGSSDVSYMSLPVPQGYSSALGIGAPKDSFRPDEHKQPVLVQEIGLILSYDQTAMPRAVAEAFLSAVKRSLETPLRLLAG